MKRYMGTYTTVAYCCANKGRRKRGNSGGNHPILQILTEMKAKSVLLNWLACPLTPPLCVQMDFTRTFEANTKCNNNKYVWNHFYQILVILKHQRSLWNNVFDTDISRSISRYPQRCLIHTFNVVVYTSKTVCVKDIIS